MEPKKKSKKILIILIILVVILIVFAGVAYTYFATDLFKSNKQAFFEYISDVGDKELANYFEKVKNTPYENSGNFSVNITSNHIDEEKLEKLNDFNISFNGKVDEANSKSEQEISINYADDVNFPITYRNTSDIFAIQTKYIGSKYLGLETKNIIELLREGTFSGTNENDSNEGLSEEEIEHIYQTYIPVITQKLNDNNFSKIKENNQTGYKLTLTDNEVKNIFIAILENLKNDEVILEKLGIKSNDVDNLIENIQNSSEETENTYEMTVYKENKQFKKLSIKLNISDSPIEITMERTKSNNEVQYIISLNTEQGEIPQIQVTASYSGLENLSTVQERYEIGVNGSFSYENSVLSTAKETGRKTEVAEEEEQVNLLIDDTKVNKYLNGENETSNVSFEDLEETANDSTDYRRMNLEKISDTEFKVIFSTTSDEFTIDNTGKITSKPETDSNESEENENEQEDLFSYIYTYSNLVNFVENVDIEELDEENTVILNKQKENYVTNLMGAIGERLQQVNSKLMKEIEFEENENPIVYLIPGVGQSMLAGTSSSMENQVDELEVTSFNQKFEVYESTNTRGATVKGLLSTIQANNENEEQEHKIEEINFDGQEYEVTEQNITLLKSEINVEDKYKVEFEKNDDTGIIFRAVINKK